MMTAACGSTLPPNEQLTGIEDFSGGVATSPQGGGVERPIDSSSNGPDARSSTDPATGSTGSKQPKPSSTDAIGTNGPGVTPTSITIGALTANGAGKFQESLGFSGATGDQIAMTKSVVNWLNQRGGIGGRKTKLVLYDVSPGAVVADANSAFQAACAAFTQDDKVFAVASILSSLPPSFYECLRKAGVLAVTTNAMVSSRFYKQYAGTMYSPNAPSYTRILANSVDALWADGWLTKSSKVGVVGYDTPDARATVTDGLVPALQRHGLKVAESLYTSDDTSAVGSEYSGGVLKFKAGGVDRVFFAPGGQPIYMAHFAQAQGYHPLLEMSTLEFPAAVAANVPAAALRGSAGVGWSPDLDLDNASADKVPTPGRPQCIDAVRAANQDLTTGTTRAIATWICDDWFLIRDALARATAINRSQFRVAVEGLGNSFRSATTFQTLFAPDRTSDAAAGYRLNKFNDACSCYRYASGTRPLK